eukprot:c19839_g1_i1 orf=493-918(-)
MAMEAAPDVSRWVVIYPIYLDSRKTLAEGRRINSSRACQDPTVAEIGDCCSYLKLPFAIEADKAYSRDFMQRGRVRVQLKREDGTLVNPGIPSRKILMLKVAELVPKHTGRTRKQDQAAAAGASSSSANTGRSGKSGKKKK